ncbi:DUF5103 domain-containing protein [Spongiivirga sp. MCCC 1A20706]|uniref:type IX secretion system plug protein n=1 Tax=Spongiivirga sp. MCCC 1A20706 TaxID=3160963 RepID=UPI003977B2F5
MNLKHLLLFIFVGHFAIAQIKYEENPPENIKTIVFKGSDDDDQFPIIKLNESVLLKFDDLNGDEANYYYKLTHCNFDWTPSNIPKNRFLDGFDNERIINYRNSLNALTIYSHYELSLPNNKTRFKIGGNYILEIFNQQGDLMFSRRFIVYENIVNVGVTIKRARDVAVIDQKQVVQLDINTNSLQYRNPEKEIKVAILQNYLWDTAITDLKPQFVLGNKLQYRYDEQARFDGGNEFLNFDSKDIRTSNINVSHVELGTIYNQYLYTDEIRSGLPYTYNPDINGDFLVTSVNGDPDIEADYARMHFSLPYNSDIGLQKVYVVGKFNNYQVTDEYELLLDQKVGLYKGNALFKQGFYNYKYVTVDNGIINDVSISGSLSQTENNYTVLVYFRKFGAMYDSVIGVGLGDSSVITN